MWNCNDLTDRKCADSNCTNLLTEYDFIVLLESWTCNISKSKLDGHHCFDMYRKYRHRKARRNSGGIVVYVRNEDTNDITLVRNNHTTTVWFKFDKRYLCCCCVSME